MLTRKSFLCFYSVTVHNPSSQFTIPRVARTQDNYYKIITTSSTANLLFAYPQKQARTGSTTQNAPLSRTNYNDVLSYMVSVCHAPRQLLPKPSFRALWKVGDTVVSRGNAWRTTSKSGHPCPYIRQRLTMVDRGDAWRTRSKSRHPCPCMPEQLTMAGRENAWWKTSKSRYPCPYICQNVSQWSLPEKTGRGSLSNRPHALPPTSPPPRRPNRSWG